MRQRTLSRVMVAMLSATCAGALLATPAAAAGNPDDHEMGSQIELHEGENGSPAKPVADAIAGIDVSSHQGAVDWNAQWDKGNRFAYVKATEGTSYTSDTFAQQYNGSYDVGMIRGAYHFALPGNSSGKDQANHFVDHGGGWSGDGKTLPGALDMEYNPYGDTCYNLSPEQMKSWISEFSSTYQSRTGRHPVIYTSTSWWKQCVSGDFGDTSPLWVANYAEEVGELPPGWSDYTFWQYTDEPLDSNVFNGSMDELQALAQG